jgi:beta-glucosidase
MLSNFDQGAWMNWKRVATGLVVALSLTAWVRADEPKTTATTRPSAQAIPDEPAVASGIKSINPTAQQQFLDRHEGFLKDKEEALKKGPIQFVLIGDSITDGWRNKNSKPIFDEAFGKYNPYNIGIGGDRTQHVIWRIDNGELDGLDPNPKVAMIMIGTNNLGNPSNEAIEAGIEKIVKQVHEKLPKTKILLLGVFPRGRQADNPYRARIKEINDALAKLDNNGRTVKFLDIGDKFLDSDGKIPNDVMPDPPALHPNAKGYQIWADAVTPTIDEMMK